MKAMQPNDKLALFTSKMKHCGLPAAVIDLFSHCYRQILSGNTGVIDEQDILPVHPDDLPDFSGLASFAETGKKHLKHAVMIVLNGGLGTSMGLTGPKSLIAVKNGKTFLDIILEKAASHGVRVGLMNSFNTHNDTQQAIKALGAASAPMMFIQHKFPKIMQKDLTPAQWPENPALEWNPPGHGDIYTALHTSGMLDSLLEEDIQYAFICNSDNLGASLDPALLGFFAEKNLPFMMEVSRRTRADMKGGHLARRADGRLILREAAQCREKDMEQFKDIAVHRFFNTNNLWINLKFLKALIQKQGAVRLPLIVNPKRLDPRDKISPLVFQAETAMGAAISLFDRAIAVKVPRNRFFPVKKCNDLLLLKSDCFKFTDTMNLVKNPDLEGDLPFIDLDPEFYGHIDRFNQRFEKGIPSLRACQSLTVKGDVFFGEGVVIRGHVTIMRNTPGPVWIQGNTMVDRDMDL